MPATIAMTDDLATCLALRREVFTLEQGVSEADEVDGRDSAALHLLATLGGRPVGTARILVEGTVGTIGRVCVLSGARGTGTGAALIRAAVALLSATPGVTQARLGAQVQALEFYARLGFAVAGPVYDDAGIAHRRMEIDL